MIPLRTTVLPLLLTLASPGLQAEEAPPLTPPAAVAPTSPSLSDLSRSLQGYFTEEERDLLFQYMLDSVVASFKGEEVALPPDLAFKLEILLVRMKREGGHYLDNVIKKLEQDLERNLKEKLTPPDTSASTYIPPAPPAFTAPALPPPAVPGPALPAQPPQFVPPSWPVPQAPSGVMPSSPNPVYQVPTYQVPAFQAPAYQIPAYQVPAYPAPGNPVPGTPTYPAYQGPVFPFFPLPFFFPYLPADP